MPMSPSERVLRAIEESFMTPRTRPTDHADTVCFAEVTTRAGGVTLDLTITDGDDGEINLQIHEEDVKVCP